MSQKHSALYSRLETGKMMYCKDYNLDKLIIIANRLILSNCALIL